MNSDGVVDVFDLIYVVDYIMSGGPGRVVAKQGAVSVYSKENMVFLSTDTEVAGVQFTLSEPVTELSNTTNLELMHKGNTVLLFGVNGGHLFGEKIALFELPEGVSVNEAKASGHGGVAHKVTIGALPDQFAVHQNYPNPFNPSTQIRIDLAEITKLTVKVYDASGREVQELVNTDMMPGFHKLTWNGKDMRGQKVASGIYFFRVITPETVKTVKAILLR